MSALENYESSTFVFNVRVDNYNLQTAIDRVVRFITGRPGGVSHQVLFTNVHSIQLARHDPELLNCINHADLVLADGSGLKIAGRLFGHPIEENLNGTDFTPRVLALADRNNWSVYLLGAREEVVSTCCQKLDKHYPNLRIAGYRNGYFTHDEEKEIIEDINNKKPDILLVALGSPRQEEWIAHHRRLLNAHVCFGVGGLFDFIAGMRKRAPLWMRKTGIEWVYRFLQSPSEKWERIFVEIPAFLLRIIWNKLLESTMLVEHRGKK
ncbi:MAG TPA: WecB/TagA/CpsF family glycosyltransferase [Balneolales bacterium]|nr:WecB/TagA/CpsF family glycosyltransferase [Balneolales bacterium]